MLINVADDSRFQRYLDREEQRLHVEMMPVITAGIRMQLFRGSTRAQAYMIQRGEPVLMKAYRRIYTDEYNAISEIEEIITKAEGLRPFLASQLDFLRTEALQNIHSISGTVIAIIHDLIMERVREGASTDRITREIYQKAPEIGATRAATIARTETHNSALAAIDATLAHKQIKVRSKTWWSASDKRVRPSHQEAHGQTVDYDQPFSVGDSQMMRPGDSSLGAGAEEIVNCRCAVLFNVKGRQPPVTAQQSSAADLYQPPTKTAEQIIAEHGAAKGIEDVRARLAKLAPTDAPVDKGGFRLPDGTYTTQRKLLHEKIVDEMFSERAVARALPAEGERPTLTMLGGRGGSGKSWLTGKDGPVDATRAILLDSDHIKSLLPGYQGWNAALYHEESSHILSMADKRATDLGVNVINDATLKSKSTVGKRVAQYEAADYQLEGFYMYLGPDDAAGRAMSRFSKGGTFTGRFVPPEVILGNTANEKNFDEMSPKFVRWGVYDNSGKSPKLVQEKRGR